MSPPMDAKLPAGPALEKLPVAPPTKMLLTRLGDLLKNIEARDKILKLSGYTTRLLHYHKALVVLNGGDEAVQSKLTTLDRSIVDARQMINLFKYVDSSLLFIKTAARTDLPAWQKAAQLLRIFFWTIEVVSSDLTFIAKYFVHGWDKTRIGYYYKMGKSIALTIVAALESIAIAKMLKAASKRSASRQPQKPASEADDSAVSAPSAALAKALPLTVAERAALKEKLMVILRCFCDCFIYYVWIPSYNPDKGLCYIAGFLSASVGLYQQASRY
eukprot:TRINITY_DN1765_c5_g1_i1.p1 TRINITY_DN1765_c5_g1~~TRINITY_DN1765_c5_g1_i1.p1  ORF type:complete len:273 (+),score=131.11 TRINITY_DN1765_c5_g1_i1:207-1025(+)